jgi:F-type H+-transporting ATPase subunit c
MDISMAAVGAGLVSVGAGLGIGLVGAATMQGMARQPEMVAALRATMFIAAALIEGVAFFSLIICIVK